jgi:cell fate (sporulation/competence/biofilm development) regulator YlbF (YheA/YmcA/DUF963 family)
MDLDDAVQNMIKSLSDSKEFAELKEATGSMRCNPVAMSCLKDFQRKKIQLQEIGLSSRLLQPAVDELTDEFEKLNSVPELKKYFEYVDIFNELMFSVIKKINQTLEKELLDLNQSSEVEGV